MNLSIFKKDGNTIDNDTGKVVNIESLEDVWARAEQIGRVEVDSDWTTGSYTVKIMFTRRSGTRVWATGNDMSIRNALLLAIQEAELLSR